MSNNYGVGDYTPSKRMPTCNADWLMGAILIVIVVAYAITFVA